MDETRKKNVIRKLTLLEATYRDEPTNTNLARVEGFMSALNLAGYTVLWEVDEDGRSWPKGFVDTEEYFAEMR